MAFVVTRTAVGLAPRPAPAKTAGTLQAARIAPSAVFKSAHSTCSTSGCVNFIARHAQRGSSIVVCAKGKGKGKGAAVAVESKGGKAGKAGGADVDADQIEKETKADAEERMKKALTVMADNFNTIRTGRANPAILDRITVDYYGVPTPLNSVCTISVPDSSTLLLTPFERSTLKDIERAINESDLGVTPSNDGERIRLGLPQLTQERRKDLVKQVSKMGEETKVAVRNVRKDVMKKLDKVDAFSKDAKKALEDGIQKLTDSYCKRTDDLVKSKSDELMKL